jgi:hypothetical protein
LQQLEQATLPPDVYSVPSLTVALVVLPLPHDRRRLPARGVTGEPQPAPPASA